MQSPTAAAERGAQSNGRYKCLSCGSPLQEAAEHVSCPACGKQWPVRDGVPRFFEPAYYWGEVPKDEAAAFLGDVRSRGWRSAVEHRFADDADMRIGLLDWQRASWLPLLALPADAVALDIGSGYGAITHAMSRGVGTLYSVEAIPERLEFTRFRLEQEQLSNVQLVQASGLQLPFVDEMFDLIVVNGVLEWVGEWSRDGSPREVQQRFLRDINRLLRPGGVLIIGIENRFGYQFLRGGLDHSGLAYTSLMPHWMATAYLKLRRFRHRRSVVNERREYRTYIYTQQGYRDLLEDCQFPKPEFYWADPGYNQPFDLVPLRDTLPEQHFERKLAEPSQAWQRTWKRTLKAAVGRLGILSFFAPDFVIVAQKGAGDWRQSAWQRLRSALPQLPALTEPILALSTRSFGLKSLIRVFTPGGNSTRVMLKSSTAAPGSPEALDAAYRALEIAAAAHGRRPSALFRLPQLLGRARIGQFVYSTEAAVPGLPLSHSVFSITPSDALELLSRELPRAVDVAVEIATMLRGVTGIAAVDERWFALPVALAGESSAPLLATVAHDEWTRTASDAPWAQHGDFTIENVFVEPGQSQVSVIDWEHLVSGAPALYDVFSLLVSALPAVDVADAGRAPGDTPWTARFETAFFGTGPWADLYRDMLRRASSALAVPEPRIWSQFAQFLILRSNFQSNRNTRVNPEHLAFLRVAAAMPERFVLAP